MEMQTEIAQLKEAMNAMSVNQSNQQGTKSQGVIKDDKVTT